MQEMIRTNSHSGGSHDKYQIHALTRYQEILDYKNQDFSNQGRALLGLLNYLLSDS
jgi:hypothetical protein